MFTGIIQDQGEILNLSELSGSRQVSMNTGFNDLELGESIAVNGVCLTVVEFHPTGQCLFFVSPETLNRSNLSELKAGMRVNLERALRLESRLSGHIVQGHVDGLAKLLQITPLSESFQMEFELPAELAQYCIEKGSISINGVSLTINSIQDSKESSVISVMIIPHTWSHTNLSQLTTGAQVNIEVDLFAKYMAKYVERLCRP